MTATPPDATPGQRLLLALLGVARRLRTRGTDGPLDASSVFVLYQVQLNPAIRVSDLAACVRLDSSTVSRHVRHLEDSGYLARTGDPEDRRAARLQLTSKGRAFLEASMRAKAAIIDQATADWPAEDREALTTLMTRLAERIDRLVTEKETG